MPEGIRTSFLFTSMRRIARWLTPAVVLGLAACTESFEGGAACPSLCPGRVNDFRDTVIDAVVVDSTVGGFPVGGLNSLLLLANRGDTLQTSAVIRFDQLPRTFKPNNTGDTVAITAIDSLWLRLALDTTGRLGTEQVQVLAYDVDTTASDTVTSVVQSLFRPDRLLGSATITPGTHPDSLRLFLDEEKVLDKIQNKKRLRVGLKLSGPGQLRILAFVLGSGAPLLRYDPSTDDTYAPIVISANTVMPNVSQEQALGYTVYPIIERAAPAVAGSILQVGGYPASRTYLRFNIPNRFVDSATIVRAELLVTQVASPFARTTDTVFVEPTIPTASGVVTDLKRALDLALGGSWAGLDSTRFISTESGPRIINVLGIVRNWRFLPDDVPFAIGLRSTREGITTADVRFLSLEGGTAQADRPRLRITYLPRSEFALP